MMMTITPCQLSKQKKVGRKEAKCQEKKLKKGRKNTKQILFNKTKLPKKRFGLFLP